MAGLPKQTCDLFVTCIDKVGPLLKIWGQIDRQTSIYIETVLMDMLKKFEQQNYPVPLSSLHPGLVCCAKYKDGIYYRAQVKELITSVSGVIEVRFIDYGNIELIQLEDIRLFQDECARLSIIKPQATDYILAGAMHINNDWDKESIALVHHEIAYTEQKTIFILSNPNYKLVKILYKQFDLATYLICKGICTAIPLPTQEMILQSSIQPQMQPPKQLPRTRPPAVVTQSALTYKPSLLPLNSENLVYVSFVEDGPYLFSIQLQSMEESLNKLMRDINELPLMPLSEPPVPGYPCMARCVEDNTICRAVILNLVGDKCKTYFVDFGNTDILPFSDIFQIPPEYMLPKVMSMRFTLSGLKDINITEEMKCSFTRFVTNKLLKLRVVKEGNSALIQYCELHDETGKNIAEIILSVPAAYKNLQFNKGTKHNVVVSFVEGRKKFFVQLKECLDSLASLMMALAATSENSPGLDITDLKPGTPCCALHSADNKWYRAKILSITGSSILIKYIDYGNEESLQLSSLKKMNRQFVEIIPEQAIECCLYGYQNIKIDPEIEDLFESLTLELDFTMKVIHKQSNNLLLVDLFDVNGSNVEAILMERLVAMKSQMTLPAQQITRQLVNDNQSYDQSGQVSSGPFSPKDKSPKDKPWRNERVTERQQSWRSDNSEEKKNWRGSEEKSWRNASSPNEEKPPKFQSTKKSNDNNRKMAHKKRREKWSDQGAGGDSWNKRENRGSRGENSGYRGENSGSRGENSGSRGENSGSRSENYNSRGENSWEDKKRAPKWGNEKPREFSERKPWNEKRQDSWDKSKSDDKPFQKRDWKDDRKPREFKPRENKYDRLNSQEWDENASTSSHGSRKGKSFSPKKDYSSPKREIAKTPEPLSDLTEPFKLNTIEIGSNDKVAISWFYNPENFFCQILSQEHDFKTMMTEIQTAYSTNKIPLSGPIPIGSSVIAEFSEDSILYRATVLEDKGLKYKVQYVDFGNMSLVDSNKIYQVETRFMKLPAQSVRCGIGGIKPVNDWPVDERIDQIFNKDSFICVFESVLEDRYAVQLWDGEVCIKNQLLETGLAKDGTTLEMDGEPTDINMLIGQNIRVILSSVYSLEKFYVQLNKAKVAKVEEAIQAYVQNTTALQVMTADMILPDINCLVKTEEKWYRGLIIDNTNIEEISVVSPDTGRQFKMEAKDLYVLPAELCIYWYQAFECTLHNLTSDVCRLISDEKFKSDYEGKEFIMYMNTIIEKPLITLYDTNGVKLELFEPDEEAFPTVDKICTLPVYSQSLSVYISHIENGSSIYLQQSADINTIAELLEKLYEYYETNGEPSTLEQYSLCVAKSEDGNWYRARVEEVTDDVKVSYIDYGNMENVPKENVKELVEQFYEPHELALNVSLNLTESSEEFKNKLTEITTDKDLKCNIYFDGVWLVELFDGETSINHKLVECGVAKVMEMPEPILCVCPAKPIEERRAAILVTHIDSPGEFYVQLKANENDIAMLQEDLQDKIDTLPNLVGSEVGSLCAAKYSVDELWYRAEVLDADSDITTVRFVDFGNTDVIDNTANNLKTLSSELLAIDKYAKKCSLNVSPKSKSEEWSQEVCDIFINEIEKHDYMLFADIVYQDEKNKHYVELYDQNEGNVAQILIDGGHAVHITRDIEDNIANNTGFVSHLNTISEFWIQLESSVPDLEMIVERMTGVDEFPDMQDLSPGMLCAANYPDDEQWYRARILSNTVAGVEVLFIDYGNSSNALKIKELPEELVHMPALAQKCCLNKPSSVTQWTEEATEKFREISEDGATVFNVKKLAPGETAIVELFIRDENIVEQLIPLCGEERPVPMGEPQFIKCYINHIDSLDKFWVSKHSDQEILDDIMNQVNQAETFEPLSEVETGKICATFDESTEIWYRASVISKDEVLLYDYGNVVAANNLKTLPDELEKIPPVSFLCTLELPQNSQEWSPKVLDKFLEINAQVNNEYELEFLNNETPRLVRIYNDGVNICEKLIKGENILNDEPVIEEIKTVEDVTEQSQIKVVEPVVEVKEDSPTNEATVETIEINEAVLNTTEANEAAVDTVEAIKEAEDKETIEKHDETIEKYDETVEKDETIEKDDETIEKHEEIVEKVVEILEKIDKTVEKDDKTTEKDETTEKPDTNEVSKIEELKAEKESAVNGIEDTQSKETVTEIHRSSDEVFINDNNLFVKQDLVFDLDGDQNLCSIQEMTENKDVKFIEYREEICTIENSSQTDIEDTDFNDNLQKQNFEDSYDTNFDYELCESFSNLSLKDDFLGVSNNFDPGKEISPQTKKLIDEEKNEIFNCIYEQYPNTLIHKKNLDTQVPFNPHEHKIVPGSISRGDITVPQFSEQKFSPIPHEYKIVPGFIAQGFASPTSQNTSNCTDLVSPPSTNLTLESDLETSTYLSFVSIEDKIVPGSISRGDLSEPDLYNNPVTPREEKIVPGSICRGICVLNIEPVALDFENETPNNESSDSSSESFGSQKTVILKTHFPSIQNLDEPNISNFEISLYTTPECMTDDLKPESGSLEPNLCNPIFETSTFFVYQTPEEKIVPGSISRGYLERNLDLGSEIKFLDFNEITCTVGENMSDSSDNFGPESGSLDSSLGTLCFETSTDFVFQTPEEKIVPGCISRGDLESSNLGSDFDRSENFKILCTKFIKTPKEEKMVPGCISRGNLQEPEPDLETEPNFVPDIFYHVTSRDDKIVPGSISTGNLQEPEPDLEIEPVLVPDIFYPVTPRDDKIVPGSISRGNLLEPEPDLEIEPVLVPEIFYPVTPRDDKIVPGSISRGNLQEPEPDLEIEPVLVPANVYPVTPRDDKIVPGSISRGNLQEPEPDLEPEPVLVPEIFYPVTPRNDKIVPGSISRGNLQEPEPDLEMEPVLVPANFYPVTPRDDKIVPGSISRGNLQELEPDLEIEPVLVPENIYHVTPRDDKIVPGSISRGNLQEPEPDLVSEIFYHATSRDDKIVPGSVSRGNLQEPEPDLEAEPDLMPEILYPVTPRDDKIVPGCVSWGDEISNSKNEYEFL